MQSSLYQSFKTFSNNEFGEIRTLNINNEPWFVGKDVVETLGYDLTTNRYGFYVNKFVECEDRLECNSQSSFGIDYKELGQRGGLLINESGLYDLIFNSKLPSAKKFKRWVTSEVLPSIRKTGGYIPTNEEDDDATIMAKALMVAQKTINKKDELLKAKTRELEDKNRFINQIASSQNTLLVREVAKVISSKEGGIVIGERKLYQKLRDWGLIFKNKNEPKQQYIKQGLFEVVEGIRNTQTGTFTYQTMKVTGKGQQYILNRLLKEKKEIA